ncbi:hypothetical protein Esti_000548 [Eimeria stiedai]
MEQKQELFAAAAAPAAAAAAVNDSCGPLVAAAAAEAAAAPAAAETAEISSSVREGPPPSTQTASGEPSAATAAAATAAAAAAAAAGLAPFLSIRDLLPQSGCCCCAVHIVSHVSHSLKRQPSGALLQTTEALVADDSGAALLILQSDAHRRICQSGSSVLLLNAVIGSVSGFVCLRLRGASAAAVPCPPVSLPVSACGSTVLLRQASPLTTAIKMRDSY